MIDNGIVIGYDRSHVNFGKSRLHDGKSQLSLTTCHVQVTLVTLITSSREKKKLGEDKKLFHLSFL